MHASLGNVVSLMPGIREIHAARGNRREPWPRTFEPWLPPSARQECSIRTEERQERQSANDATNTRDQIPGATCGNGKCGRARSSTWRFRPRLPNSEEAEEEDGRDEVPSHEKARERAREGRDVSRVNF
jgi:hypothetical protein